MSCAQDDDELLSHKPFSLQPPLLVAAAAKMVLVMDVSGLYMVVEYEPFFGRGKGWIRTEAVCLAFSFLYIYGYHVMMLGEKWKRQ